MVKDAASNFHAAYLPSETCSCTQTGCCSFWQRCKPSGKVEKKGPNTFPTPSWLVWYRFPLLLLSVPSTLTLTRLRAVTRTQTSPRKGETTPLFNYLRKPPSIIRLPRSKSHPHVFVPKTFNCSVTNFITQSLFLLLFFLTLCAHDNV